MGGGEVKVVKKFFFRAINVPMMMGQMIDVIELSMNKQECISECRSLSKWHKRAFPRKTSPNAMILDDPSFSPTENVYDFSKFLYG